MGHDALKIELIEWLTKLDDEDTINYLKIVKDSKSFNNDWWDELTIEQKEGIERGIRDIDEGNIVPHEEIKKRYDL